MKKFVLQDEKNRLAKIAEGFSMEEGITAKLGNYFVKTILEDLINGSILDVGCADGIMAKRLSPFVKHITAIDGSEKLIKKAKEKKLKNVKFIRTLFEEYNPKQKFDTVILSDILEHIYNPITLLKMAREWVNEGGVIIIISPNANSIHRQIGVIAGMMQDIHDLNETDLKVGHRRVYDIKTLANDIAQVELKIIKKSGIFLKPLSDSQLNALEDNIIDAFYLIGKRLEPDLLALLYFVCKKIN